MWNQPGPGIQCGSEKPHAFLSGVLVHDVDAVVRLPHSELWEWIHGGRKVDIDERHDRDQCSLFSVQQHRIQPKAVRHYASKPRWIECVRDDCKMLKLATDIYALRSGPIMQVVRELERVLHEGLERSNA